MRSKILYQQAPTRNNENGFQLDLENMTQEQSDLLPTVSVITISNNSKNVASLLNMWIRFIYPPKKMEWIIVEGDADIENYLPDNDDRIHYYRAPENNSQTDLLNYAITKSNNDYIVHMNDDCYYFADSILSKIRILTEKNRQGILTWNYVTYNPVANLTLIYTRHQTTIPYFATLAYKKSYWENRKFTEDLSRFIGKKNDKWVDLPFIFNCMRLEFKKADEIIVDNENYGKIDSMEQYIHEKYMPVLQNMIELNNV
jgi:hypothetical protein